MRQFIKPTLLSITIGAVLAGCSSSGDQEAMQSEYSILGRVPGTLIEAFCDDGRYFSTHSDSSGPDDQHPFELELPVNLSCRLVMTTGEDSSSPVVTPIGFISAEISSIAFQGDRDIDIGYIPLAMQPDPGCAVAPPSPTYDKDCDGIVDSPIYVEVEDDEIKIILATSDPMDEDRDNIIDAYEDDDDDGIPNCKDDNAGTNDLDGDGIENHDDVDDDNDEKLDDEDPDDDNDGVNDDYDDEDGDDHDEDSENGSAPTFTADDPSAGRLLVATQCAQCHGTDGFSKSDIDSIAGESRNELLRETVEDANDPDDLMGFHGGAYLSLSPELEAIADYLSKR
jgi:hypothetical protein